MVNSPDSDVYPTQTYIDPLVMPQFLQTNNWFSIREQVNGDWLLASFICKLNQEIVDDIKEWKDFKTQIQAIFDATRTYGWCVFQSYAEFDKVFTPQHWESWITETNSATGKLEKVGVNVRWTDELGNAYSDALYFAPTVISEEAIDDETEDEADDTMADSSEVKPRGKVGKRPKVNKVSKLTLQGQAYLFIWKEGNGTPLTHCPIDSKWAIPDLDLSVLSLAIQIRQIQNTLTFSACNPFFYHLVYGTAITPAQRLNLISQMSFAGVSMGVGAQKAVLEEIRAIENGATEKCQNALNTLISFYAATTRLPLSFYFGEKQIGSGLDSGGAEDIDQERIMKKKEYILQHFAAQLTEIASTLWGITLPDLYGFYEGQRQEQEKKKAVEKKMELGVKTNAE